MRFKATLAILTISLTFAAGFAFGESYLTKSAESTIEVARQVYEEHEAANEHNNDVFSQYIDGEITQEEANAMMVPGKRKTAHIALKQLKGTVTFGVYDPANDPHAGPGSRFGEKSCVLVGENHEYGCGQDESTKVQCVIYATFSDGPMKGTIFYGKSCDGQPICRLLPRGDEVVITYDYSKSVKLPDEVK